MSEVASLLEQLKAAAELHGADWLQSQITESLRGVQQAPAGTRPASVRARRSVPPERFSPDNTPRSQRRTRSPSRPPSGPPAKQASATISRAGGGGEKGAKGAPRGESPRLSRPSSPVLARAQVHMSGHPGGASVGGSARRGKGPSAGAGLALNSGGGLARGVGVASGMDGAAQYQSRQSGGPASRPMSEPGRVGRRGNGAQAAAAVLMEDRIEEYSSEGDESPRGGGRPHTSHYASGVQRSGWKPCGESSTTRAGGSGSQRQ